MRTLVFSAIAVCATVAAILVPDAKPAVTVAGLTVLAIAGLACGRRVRSEVAYALFISFLLNFLVPHIYTPPDFAFFGGSFSTFSFVGWAVGLTALGRIYRSWQWENRWAVSLIAYYAVLFTAEYAGYHLLDIRLAGDLPSFLGTGVLHGTLKLHVAYVLAGPVYLFVVDRFAWS
ncbi:MAG TPA: hypothetical protein VD862_01440 [Candidatus Paceibacterota bacterium]|nr:hypothetical protein [Candidatus Paceibacterota bacterium]